MSRSLICVFLTCVCVVLSQHDEYRPWYVCEESGIYFKKGQVVTVSGKCARFTCLEAGINMIRLERCNELTQKPGCILEPMDMSKKFPNCCEKLVCA